MSRPLRCITFACWMTGSVIGSSQLQAQSKSTNKAAADALFDDARNLMSAGQYSEACAKLEASQALDRGVGTALNLADCYEKSGRTASAWAQFRETVSAARNAGSLERERVARERVLRLEPRLSYLTITTWKGQSVTVTRDGEVVEPAVLGTAIPVDPGPHEITASAPGKRAFHTQINVEDSADRVSVTVPILTDEPAPALTQPLAVAAELQPSAASRQPRAQDSDGGDAQRTIALVSAAFGVAGIATGTVFGLKAASTYSDAKSHCSPYCSPRADSLSQEAQQSGTISTIAFAAGGAGLAAFTVLWLTAPSASQDETPLSFAFGPMAVSVRGRL